MAVAVITGTDVILVLSCWFYTPYCFSDNCISLLHLCNVRFSLSSFRNLNFTVLSKRVCLIHYFCTFVIVLIFNTSLFWLDVPFFNWLDIWFSPVDHQKSPRNPSQTIQMGLIEIFKLKMILHPSWLLFTVCDVQNSAFYPFSYWLYWCLEILFAKIQASRSLLAVCVRQNIFSVP